MTLVGVLIGLILIVLGIASILDYMRWREETLLGYVEHKVVMTILFIAGLFSVSAGLVFLAYLLLTFAK